MYNFYAGSSDFGHYRNSLLLDDVSFYLLALMVVYILGPMEYIFFHQIAISEFGHNGVCSWWIEISFPM